VACRVSFVVTSRNDDHGGRMLRRFAIFADGLLEQANRHNLSGELIVVEWNPPAGPRLHEVLKLRQESATFAVRFIEAPPEAHGAIRNSDTIPLFQMIAKNVGIRRARGEFVVATNPDVLFSDALITLLARGELQTDTMYRLDRQDVAADVPDGAGVTEQLDWCARHVLRIHGRAGTMVPADHGARWSRLYQALASVPLQLRKAMARAYLLYGPRRVLRNALALGLKKLLAPPDPHVSACGDFTMIARRRWFELRGYAELPLWSMHLDAFLCFMAVAAGLRERILDPPCGMFHMEHEQSWVVMTPEDRLRTFAAKPWIDVWLLGDLWENARRTGRPIVVNETNWGLADWHLEEVRLLSGERQVLKLDSPTVEEGR
jgi:hypothetical protein